VWRHIPPPRRQRAEGAGEPAVLIDAAAAIVIEILDVLAHTGAVSPEARVMLECWRGPRAATDRPRTRSNHHNLLRSAHRDCDHVAEGFVLSSIWDFPKDGSNQAVLSWIGGGIVFVAGGLWAALKFFFPKEKDKSAPPPAVHADHGGFAAGGTSAITWTP
jgi:hypothetical protein